MYELNKREKKIAREVIEKGVQAEFKAGLEKAKKVIAESEKGDVDNRVAYQKLYKTIIDQDKRIGKRYDGLTGSRYLMTVAAILFDRQITEEDIKDFSDEAKQTISTWMSLWKKE